VLTNVLGGIGLFLIGMILTTDGLRTAAGDALRRVLLRFTGGPYKALLSGALVTALVQSSSATTLATIGFVGAGLIRFEQALGVILGANIGTTATSWLVAWFGLKFSVSSLAYPMVGIGALLKLFLRGRWSHVGLALAGFGIIFIGIDTLQGGMKSLSHILTPQQLPDDTFIGRILLIGLGLLLTAIMQSSSAAMATTLTALDSGSISLQQAAAIVIGANIGTTVTAGIAAVGASTAAKRTALAHAVFNTVTGGVAFLLLPALGFLIAHMDTRWSKGNAALSLAAFHTFFNVLGVLIHLPFLQRFAALILRLIPDRGPPLTRLLDPSTTHLGTLAI
jgi:phosphate:Na+ symporter